MRAGARARAGGAEAGGQWLATAMRFAACAAGRRVVQLLGHGATCIRASLPPFLPPSVLPACRPVQSALVHDPLQVQDIIFSDVAAEPCTIDRQRWGMMHRHTHTRTKQASSREQTRFTSDDFGCRKGHAKRRSRSSRASFVQHLHATRLAFEGGPAVHDPVVVEDCCRALQQRKKNKKKASKASSVK